MNNWFVFFRTGGALSAITGSALGYCLASEPFLWWQALALALGSFCFYSLGMGMNDIIDLKKDQKLRPERPLPSGAISLQAAKWACGGVAILGFSMTLLAGVGRSLPAALLVMSLLSYNTWAKKGALGWVSIGLCRYFNYSLGLGFLSFELKYFLPGLLLFIHAQNIMSMAEGEDLEKPLSWKFHFFSLVSAITILILNGTYAWPVALIWLGWLEIIAYQARGLDRFCRIRAVGLLVFSYSLLEGGLLLYLSQLTSGVVLLLAGVSMLALMNARKMG